MRTSLNLNSHSVDYQPLAPLDIDDRVIDGDDLRRWAGLTQWQLAQELRTTQATVSRFELNGVSEGCSGWAAMFREFFVEGIEVPRWRADFDDVDELARLLGGWDRLAESLRKDDSLVFLWHRNGIPARGGYGEMFTWLCQEFGIRDSDGQVAA